MTADGSIRGAIESLRRSRADHERVGAAAHEMIMTAIDRVTRMVDQAGIVGLAERLGAPLRQAAEAARDQRAPIDAALGTEIDDLDALLAGGAVSDTAAAVPGTTAVPGSDVSVVVGPGGAASSGSPDHTDPFDSLPPERQHELKTELIEDSNPKFPLTETNAENALRGGPPGSTPDVAGPGGAGSDVVFRDAGERVVLRREVKCFSGTFGSFTTQLRHAAQQVGFEGQVFVQVPAGTDVESWTRGWQGQRPDEKLRRYDKVEVMYHDPSGVQLGRYTLGNRLP